jgi:transposase
MGVDTIAITPAEQRRAKVLMRVLTGQWQLEEAAALLALSVRQTRRLLRAYERDGPAGLMHGNRGRTPARRLPDELREQVVRLAQGKYAGFNHQHLTEKLVEDEGLALSRTSVRRILSTAGLRSPRKRRPPKHRSRRERMPQAGMLLQADGSKHEWLGEGNGYLTLVGGIDDATGTVPWAVFREQEDAAGYMLWLRQVVQTRGVPEAVYVDRHGIFQRRPTRKLTLDEELAGGPLPTQFGRVLADLGITLICALSPQAKGRVERLWGTFQDRLGSELRLAGATTIDEANAVLARFLPAYNRRFAVPAAVPGAAYRPGPARRSLDDICCFKYDRVVSGDNTVRLNEHRLQLLPGPRRISYAHARVVVHEHLDGSLAVFHRGVCLAMRPAPADAPLLRARNYARTGPEGAAHAAGPEPTSQPERPPVEAKPEPSKPWKPGPNHPWKRELALKQRTKSLAS